MGKFKGQTIQLGAPERVLPTTSTGMDIREVRSQGSFPRSGGRFDDRGPRGDRPERSFDEAPPRRSFRDDEEVPRRTFSRRSEDDRGPRGDDAGDWRAGRPAGAEGFRRVDSTESGFERRSSTREEKPVTAADTEDDWRSGPPSRTASGFGDRRADSRREDDSSAGPRRFGSRQEDDAAGGIRRFGSRQEVATKADEEDDWRRGPREVVEDRSASRMDRTIERTRSSRAPITRADEEGDWRTAVSNTPAPASAPVSHSATPWARRATGSSEMATPLSSKKETVRAPVIASATKAKIAAVAEKLAEDRWSSSESEEEAHVEVKPDMEKISKFIERVEKLIYPVTSETHKKMDHLVKKIPVNFTAAEFGSLETFRAVINVCLKSLPETPEGSFAASAEIMEAVAPVFQCLEHHYAELGHSLTALYIDILEVVQTFVNSKGLPRISPQCSLVEDLWLALYESKILPEESFQLWLDNESLPSPGKSITLFQTEAFRAWLYDHELPGVEATVSAKAGAKDEWASDSEEDSDIESLVPKRAGAAGVVLRPTAVTSLRR